MSDDLNNKELEQQVEALFLDRILMIDNVNNLKLNPEDTRDAFVLLGLPVAMMRDIKALITQRETKARKEARFKAANIVNTVFITEGEGFDKDWHREQIIDRLAELEGEQ
jgi:hypothetical protein